MIAATKDDLPTPPSPTTTTLYSCVLIFGSSGKHKRKVAEAKDKEREVIDEREEKEEIDIDRRKDGLNINTWIRSLGSPATAGDENKKKKKEKERKLKKKKRREILAKEK